MDVFYELNWSRSVSYIMEVKLTNTTMKKGLIFLFHFKSCLILALKDLMNEIWTSQKEMFNAKVLVCKK